MTGTADTSLDDPVGSARRDSARAALRWSIEAVALIGIAILIRCLIAANTDVSWLLTAAERVLDGQRLYVDVIETNPPMAVLAYVPGVVLARALHLPVEIVTDGLVFGLILLSLMLAATCLRQSSVLDGVDAGQLGLRVIVILAIVPMNTFGQREHFALIALLPLLAVLAIRAKRETPGALMLVIAGVAAGVSLSFKPYFVIPVALVAVALGWKLKSGRALLLPELLIAAATTLAYALVVATIFPEFFTVIGPLARDVYLPVGLSPAVMLMKPGVPIWLALMLMLVLMSRPAGRWEAPVLIIVAASIGFALVFMLQRKGWPYHSYPMIALALTGLAWQVASPRRAAAPTRNLRVATLTIVTVALAASMVWFNSALDMRVLQAAVAKRGNAPRILALTAEPAVGHPLVRALNGTWVSRQQGLWVAAYVQYMREHGQIDAAREARLAPYVTREREMLVADIRRTPPSVVLIENLTSNWSDWLQANPEVAALLRDYRVVDSVNGVDILTRAP